ncbi:MAG: NAD+ synthase [Halanaerobium sp. 4-GBenrich]|jgi:NAD+ synthase|uniref:NH(3)-dependent NAD(+) synthetase n=1 Tax=Halanaerobium congolense TaxID=54121 RepID=A0A1G6JJE4_9FIRM|nr:NAD(+) synthase [Halanaerobium congolense]KXS49211.1 MAG: NAD+ synthase [Halanaerobium sp. T82-1]ODS50524.1 MAG: NAD+ synthase [Halanaerobium sp. 4-GBenrich]OEG63403.1 MAG: NAD(+) synthase [Halanaerobium sp. MDAL1]PUU92805.1 MAG: NAD+ synthase [Halanaerobium sp.]PTX16232.1 NAD+ synthase [Halanaerobium congolense]
MDKNLFKNHDYEKIKDNLVSWLQERVETAGLEGAVVGLSGGIDSAVTARLAQLAFGENLLTVIMPCHSSSSDREDALKIANEFQMQVIENDLSDVYDHLLDELKSTGIKDGKLAEANIKPRLRMTSLYYYAQIKNYLVIGTDNWSELKIGYFTKHGDGGIDLAPLGSLVKHEVKELAQVLDIPAEIIEKKPSAGLWDGQTDESEMGFSYEELDQYILSGKAEPEVEAKIKKLASKNSHKVAPVPIPNRDKLL